jgi:hypothetical protein
MQELVIDITESGKVESIYSDTFNLGFLGAQKVYRQTDIVFETISQTWDIHYLNEDGTRAFGENAPPALAGFTWYEEARKFEVAWLNACREQGVASETDRLALASKMRQ